VETIDRFMLTDPDEYFGAHGENLDTGTITAATTDAEIKTIAGDVDRRSRPRDGRVRWIVVDYLIELRDEVRDDER
jgi:hypothetical protein